MRALYISVIGAVMAASATANTPEDDANTLALDETTAQNCVSIRRINRTDIVDDRNIVFHMQGKKIYLNKLPRRCPGLRSSDTFSYRNNTGQLCDVDIITVLDSFGGDLRRGASCGLGDFFPITEDDLVVLKNPDLAIDPDATEADIESEDAGS